MCETGLLGILKELIHAQNFAGNLQLVLLIFAWLPIIGPTIYFGQQELKCDVDKGKNDYINNLCTRQYSEQYFWSATKKGFAAGSGTLVYVTWLVYLLYVLYKTHNEEENEGIRLFRRPGIRKYYIVQIIARFLFLAAFVILILRGVTRPTDSGFKFPSQFNCTRNDDTRVILCSDKYNNEKTAFSIAILVLAAVLLILTVCEVIIELCRSRSNDVESSSEDEIELQPVENSHHLDNSENTRTSSYQDQLKRNIRSLTNWKKKLFSTDRDVKFDNIFTDLIIFEGRVSHKLKQSSLYEREGNLWQYAEPDEIKTKLDKLEDLVKPMGEDKMAPKNIFAIGRAGVGKTMLCENIIRGWAEGRLYAEEYDYAFLLNFRQLNKIKHEISLCHLLNASSHSVPLDEDTFTRIKTFPGKVLLIFDGFDEFFDQENFKEVAESLPDRGVDDVMPVQALYYKLCTGKLLPNATIITTSRASQAADSIREDREVNNPRTVEILGFDKEKIKEYVQKYFDGNNPRSEAVTKYITSRPDILALCYVPINCFLVCYCLEKATDLTEDSLPATLTELYQRIVKVFLDQHFRSGGEPTAKTAEQKLLSEATVRALSRVAYDGIKNRQLVFDKEMENLPLKVLTSCGIIHEMPGIVTQEMEFAPQYIFLHLTIQEFLAAQHIVQEFTADEFETFIISAVNEPKWEVVLQFVAGLFSEENKPTLRDEMFKQLKTRGSDLLFTKCLFEQHNEAFVKTSTEDIGHVDLSNSRVTDADCTAISFVWKHAAACDSTRSMNLGRNHIGPAGCAELRGLLQSEITELNLSENQVGAEGSKYLKLALQHSDCKLQGLNLRLNGIGAKGAKHLREALQHRSCKLQKLDLRNNGVGDEGANHLKEALQHSNCKLLGLDLHGNKIGAEGAKHLKEALQHSNCKLQKLNLNLNGVGDEGAKHLKEALQHSNCKLQKLDLRLNGIGAEGAKHLKEALQHSKCKLQKLNLRLNGIGAEGANHLKEALHHSNCKLQELDLQDNEIGTEGAKYLKEALQHRNCKLQKLNLNLNGIGDEGANHLKEALHHSNCKLQELDLQDNEIGTEGAKHLKLALQHSNCKLQELDLQHNEIGAEGAKHLKEALQHSNCKLQELDLQHNEIGAEDAKLLRPCLYEKNVVRGPESPSSLRHPRRANYSYISL